MSDIIAGLNEQGYSVVEMNQTVEGSAYQKLDSKLLGLYDQGIRKIAVVTNSDNPRLSRMQDNIDRANRILPDVEVVLKPVEVETLNQKVQVDAE